MSDLRIAIFVHQPSSVTFRPTSANDARLTLFRYNHPDDGIALGMRQLDPGIYLICAEARFVITGENIDVITFRGKDDPSDPRIASFAPEYGASVAAITDFLRVNLDASPEPATDVPDDDSCCASDSPRDDDASA